jgi:hypothetical protein
MSNRITEKDLQQIVRVLNSTCGHALENYSKDADGHYKPNPNVYHLDHAYGAVSLDQMMPTGTGVRSVLHRGTKRDLYHRISAMIDGVRAAQGQNQN